MKSGSSPGYRRLFPMIIALSLFSLPVFVKSGYGQNQAPPQTTPPPMHQVTTDIHDIYGPLPLPEPIPWLLLLFAGAVLVVLIAGLLFFFLRQKNTVGNPVVPPHTAALAELAQARAYLLANQSLLYAERVSEILRSYIEKRFNIRSTRQTTTEFLHTIQHQATGSDSPLLSHKDALKKCMLQCDMAKFAHLETDKTGMEEMENRVRRFIEATTPGEEEK